MWDRNFRILYKSKHASKHTHEQAHTCKHTRAYGSLILSDALCNRILCNLCRVSRVSPPQAGGLRRSVPHLGRQLGPAEPPAGGGAGVAIVDKPRHLQPKRLVECRGSPRASASQLVSGCQRTSSTEGLVRACLSQIALSPIGEWEWEWEPEFRLDSTFDMPEPIRNFD